MERDTVQVEKMNASPLDTPHYSVSAIFPTFSHFQWRSCIEMREADTRDSPIEGKFIRPINNRD